MACLEDLKRWVLSFGDQAKVLDPPELAQRVQSEILAMYRLHFPDQVLDSG